MEDKLQCDECKETTKHSFFRDDENEVVCEDCWIGYCCDNIITVKQVKKESEEK